VRPSIAERRFVPRHMRGAAAFAAANDEAGSVVEFVGPHRAARLGIVLDLASAVACSAVPLASVSLASTMRLGSPPSHGPCPAAGSPPFDRPRGHFLPQCVVSHFGYGDVANRCRGERFADVQVNQFASALRGALKAWLALDDNEQGTVVSTRSDARRFATIVLTAEPLVFNCTERFFTFVNSVFNLRTYWYCGARVKRANSHHLGMNYHAQSVIDPPLLDGRTDYLRQD
jgi:hypothetical protein